MASLGTDMVRNSGIIGAGGAGFPTHVKLAAKVDCVIANGAECEPLLKADKQLMEHFPEKILDGMKAAMDMTGAQKGIIALKRKYADAVSSFRTRLADAVNGRYEGISIFELENFYPAGDEQVMVYEVLGRVIPEGAIPLSAGVVVDNVGTLAQISEAIEGKNVTHRWVTVTGEVAYPKTLYIPIGTSIEKMLGLCGGPTITNYRILSGGPMLGRLVNLTDSVLKTTSGIIVFPADHYVVKAKTRPVEVNVRYTLAACIQCKMCTDVCPRFNLGKYVCPDSVMKGIAYGILSKPEDMTTAFLCVECGLCTHYGCPMGLDPCGMMGKVKSELISEGMTNPHSRTDLSAREYRPFRKVPLKRLMARMDLLRYDVPAPMELKDLSKVITEVNIPLKQHIGAPSKPVVKVGDQVKKGELIADIPKGSLGARYHSSINGEVTGVDSCISIRAKKIGGIE